MRELTHRFTLPDGTLIEFFAPNTPEMANAFGDCLAEGFTRANFLNALKQLKQEEIRAKREQQKARKQRLKAQKQARKNRR